MWKEKNQNRKGKIHELSITEEILRICLEEANRAGAKRIIKIKLKIGEITNIVPECVSFYFNILSKGSIAGNAKLDIEKIPIRGKCKNCRREFFVEDFAFVCPECMSREVEMISGRELTIDFMEVQ
ncbi:MAG: hydrogenase maturation nickel metallochaperone HypA [Acidobacteriota bacterium]